MPNTLEVRLAELEAYAATLRADIERKAQGDPALFGQQIADRQTELASVERQLDRLRTDVSPASVG